MKQGILENRKSNRHILHLLLFISLLILQAALPSSPFALNLIDAYILAKDNDPLFGSAFHEHEAAMTLTNQGRSLLLPQIQASGTISEYDFVKAPTQYLDYTSQFMGITLKQPVFNLPRYHEYRQHKIRETMGDARFISAEQDLILRLAEAYFSGLAASNLLELIFTEKKAVTEQIVQAKRMLKAGVATITDVHDAEARYDTVLSQEIEAKNNLDIKMLGLRKIIGRDPSGLNDLKEDLPLDMPESESLDGWIETAIRHHPVLKSYAYQIDFRKRDLEKYKGQHWPSVDLVAGYSKTNTNNMVKTEDTIYSTVGIQVNIPLFSGGYTSAKVVESQAVLRQADKAYKNALADATQKIGEAYLGIRGSISKISALLTAVRSAYTSLTSNRMGLAAGVKTTVDVLNAQRELHDVRSKLLQARYDYILNIVKLKFSVGTLAEGDVLTINQWLQTRQGGVN